MTIETVLNFKRLRTNAVDSLHQSNSHLRQTTLRETAKPLFWAVLKCLGLWRISVCFKDLLFVFECSGLLKRIEFPLSHRIILSSLTLPSPTRCVCVCYIHGSSCVGPMRDRRSWLWAHLHQHTRIFQVRLQRWPYTHERRPIVQRWVCGNVG